MEKIPNKPNRREFLKKILGGVGVLAVAGKVEAKNENKRPPLEGEWIKKENANFSVLPEKIRFLLGKNVLIINRKWQVGGLYGKNGQIVKNENGESFVFQVGTGKNQTPTPLGVSRIIRQSGPDYRSGEFKDAENVGAPMPYAQHMVKLKVENGVVREETPRGIAIHGRETTRNDGAYSFMSHGCIGLTKEVAGDLRNILKIGDYIIIVDDERVLTGGGGYIENLIKEIEITDTNKNSNSPENQRKKKLWESENLEDKYNQDKIEPIVEEKKGEALGASKKNQETAPNPENVKKKELPKLFRQYDNNKE